MDYQKMIFKTPIEFNLLGMKWIANVHHTCIDDDIEIKGGVLEIKGDRIKHQYGIPETSFAEIKREHYFELLESAADQIQKMREWEERYQGQIQEAV